MVTIGVMANPALEAIKKVEAGLDVRIGLYDMKFLKPLDTHLLREIAGEYSQVITIEDGVINGGFGSAVLEYFADSNLEVKVRRMGVPDRFIEHGTPEELYAEIGLDADGIERVIREIVA